MMKKIFKHPFFFITILTLGISACIDEIRFDIDTDASTISIDGLISDSLSIQSIKIFESAVIGQGNDNILPPIEGATVFVRDDQGEAFEFVESEPGEYTKFMAGSPGRSYYVDITLADGKKIQSAPQVMPEPYAIDSVEFVQIPDTEITPNGNINTILLLGIRIKNRINSDTRPLLRWRANGIFELREEYAGALNTKVCYITERLDINNLILVDTRAFPFGQEFKEDILRTELNNRFFHRYAMELSQLTMTEAEFNYWNNISSILDRDGSIFNPPPGTVRGNMFNLNDPNDEILGYFSVSAVTFKRVFLDPVILNVATLRSYCTSSPFRPQGIGCTDCLQLSNSTTDRPEFW